MIIESNGKQSISVGLGNECNSWDIGVWKFCQNGWQYTGVDISVEQFDMLNRLVTNPEIVEFYEKIRSDYTDK